MKEICFRKSLPATTKSKKINHHRFYCLVYYKLVQEFFQKLHHNFLLEYMAKKNENKLLLFN